MDQRLIGLVREAVVERFGESLWRSLARGRGGGAPGGAPSDALACWIGQKAVSALRDSRPNLFDRHSGILSFVRGVGDRLPADAYRETGSATVAFAHCETPDGAILLRIVASELLCALFQGVIDAAAACYDERVRISQLKNPRFGDNACVLEIVCREERVTRLYLADGRRGL